MISRGRDNWLNNPINQADLLRVGFFIVRMSNDGNRSPFVHDGLVEILETGNYVEAYYYEPLNFILLRYSEEDIKELGVTWIMSLDDVLDCFWQGRLKLMKDVLAVLIAASAA